ncbi:MAG: PqqD family protein, partial [Myxococcales bacterium]
RRHGADIASLHPYVFYLEDIGQTFLASAIREPPVRDIARVICREFEVGEDTALRDTELFVQELVRQNVLVLKS